MGGPMLRVVARWVVLPWVMMLAGCGLGPTATDRAVFERAATEFSGVFQIEPRRDLYVEARYLRAGDCPEEGEAGALFRVLFLQPDGSRREDTNFTYLNTRNKAGRFCYQLYFNPDTRQIDRSSQAYY